MEENKLHYPCRSKNRKILSMLMRMKKERSKSHYKVKSGMMYLNYDDGRVGVEALQWREDEKERDRETRKSDRNKMMRFRLG